MSCLHRLSLLALVVLLLAGSAAKAEEQPKLAPTRDVDITYEVTRPQRPKVTERVRWLAADNLERIDSSGRSRERSTTVLDGAAHTVTLLIPSNRTFRKLEKAPRRLLEPEPGATLKRGGDASIAGSPCTDWSWIEDGETHTICVTADGVILRLVVDGQTFVLAHSLKYAPQKADLFHVPPNYSPALAPEGGAGE